MDDVLQAGRYILSEDAFDVANDNPIANWIHSVSLKEKKRRRRDAETSDKESSEDESMSSESESESEASSEDESEWRKKAKGGREKDSVVETRNVVVNEKVADDIDELAKRLRGMDVQDTMYASTYAKLCLAAPAFKAFVPAPIWPGQQPAVQPRPPQQPQWQNQRQNFTGQSQHQPMPPR
jgi:hypothetical protein